ncbi:restriction endonuclease subunit S, partial [Mycolicibacterium mageritense]|uniref:restriction endonuclease subunit S n=1 Tax=Mycolicibacterium mageritense TaxID=53462 RepID=UPI001E5C29F9
QVCVSRTASVGYVVKMGKPMATSQDFVNWVCGPAVNPDWLKWLFVAEEAALYRFGKGSTHTTIYFPEWLSLHVALPSLEEQSEIVRRVEKLFAFADRLEERLSLAQAAVQKLTPALLAKAFRGELVPQDPNDEPASELLKRLQESRTDSAKPGRARKPRTKKSH